MDSPHHFWQTRYYDFNVRNHPSSWRNLIHRFIAGDDYFYIAYTYQQQSAVSPLRSLAEATAGHPQVGAISTSCRCSRPRGACGGRNRSGMMFTEAPRKANRAGFLESDRSRRSTCRWTALSHGAVVPGTAASAIQMDEFTSFSHRCRNSGNG